MKRIFCILLAMFLICSPLAVSAEDSTGLLAELEGATVGGKMFNFADYPKVSGGEAQLLAFMEKGYSFDGNQSNYAMMVYVYNPSETAIVESGKNKITLATKFDENGVAEDYESFSLQFIDKTDNNRFYKFQVIDHVSAHDGEKIVQRVDKAGRRYTVSEIELQYVGNSLPDAIPVGQTFLFTGYQANKNLAVSTGYIETIELEVESTYWRSETSSLGEGHQNQLNSVYFSVPNEYFEEYGELQKIKAEWNEQKTSPVVVVDNQAVVSSLESWIGVEVGKHNEDCPVMFYSWDEDNDPDYLYNCTVSASNWSAAKHKITTLGYIYYDSEITVGDIGVKDTVLKKHIQDKEYADWLFSDSVDEGRTQGAQTKEISFDEMIDLESFGDTNNWWDSFWTCTIKNLDAYESFTDIPPIYKVTEFDVASTKDAATIAANLYISEDDVDRDEEGNLGLRNAYVEAVNNDSQLILFRFAATDYYRWNLARIEMNGENISKTTTGYIATETVFLGFDIIELTFFKDGLSTVIPVVSASQDIVSDITSPEEKYPDLGDGFDWSWIKTLVSLLAFLFLVVILMNPAMIGIESLGGIVSNSVDSIRTTVRRWTDKGGKK